MQKLQAKHLKTLSMMVVILIALQGCNTLPEPKITYKIDKVPDVEVKINKYGGLDKGEREKVFDLVSKLRYSENYCLDNSTEVYTKSKMTELKEWLYGTH